MNLADGCHIFISAGEYSGELLAAELVDSLREALPSQTRFSGLTGPLMVERGVRSIDDYRQFSAMGFADVLGKISQLRMGERRLMAEIDRSQISAAILVDFPGLHFFMAEQLKLRGIPVFQYVAPKVWAWGAHRIARLRRDFDLVLGVFPFEQDFFAKEHVPFRYIGCPHVDRIARLVAQISDRQEPGGEHQALGLPRKAPLIAMLPGSRHDEISRMMPIFTSIMQHMVHTDPSLHFAIPIAPSLATEIVVQYIPKTLQSHVSFIPSTVSDASLRLMKLADCCIVTSGTATLECGLVETPMVVLYRIDELSYHLAKDKLQIPYISLVNILLNRPAVREYIQLIPIAKVAAEVIELSRPSPLRSAMKADLVELRHMLDGHAAPRAAKVVADFLTTKPPSHNSCRKKNAEMVKDE